MKNQFFTPFIAFFKKLLILVTIFEVCRVLFLIFNYKYFKTESAIDITATFWYGLRFDLSVISYFNFVFAILFLLPFKYLQTNKIYQKILKYLFIIINALIILTNIIDFEFFKFQNRRSNFEIIAQQKDNSFKLTLSYIYTFWYLVIIWILIICFLYFSYIKITKKHYIKYSSKGKLTKTLMLFCVLIIMLIAGRGGLQLRPIRNFDAAMCTNPQLIPMVLNTPFSMMTTIDNNVLEKVNFYTEEQLQKKYSPIHKLDDKEDFKKLNVVIIILESFGNEYIGYFNNWDKFPIYSKDYKQIAEHRQKGDFKYKNNKTFTPFLDSLLAQGLVFVNHYANGATSMEAIPAILSSMPSWMPVMYLNSAYQANNLGSIAEKLKKKGYYTAFFHGGKNGTMGFDNYTKLVGIEEYFGADNFDDYSQNDKNWGIYDEPFLQFMIKKLNQTKQPFFSSVFTLSSHHPYIIPPKYRDKFKQGTHPIHKTIRYADWSLKRFFQNARKTKWYKNTIFILTADHSSYNETDFYKTSAGKYKIPLLFFMPNNDSMKGINYQITQQIDIMPTILKMMHYNKDFFSFGNNAFGKKHLAIQYNNNIWQIIKGNYMLQFDGKKNIALYNYSKDRLLKNNILKQNKLIAKELEENLKPIIQSYQNRIIENRLEN